MSLEEWKDKLYQECSLTWINNIPSNPTHKNVLETLNELNGEIPDTVIAVGRRSSIDLAKSIVGLYYLKEIGQLTEKNIIESIKTKDYLKNPTNILIYAVPTTSGAGSEVTQ